MTTLLGTEKVPIDRLHPNPWNPNVMSEEMYARELASIRRHGFLDPILAREMPGRMGHYQIIDGEHRWRAAKELGYEDVPVFIVIATDDEAEELTVLTNELRGTPDPRRLSVLIQEMVSRKGESTVREIMPFDQERFNELAQIKRIDWDDIDRKRDTVLPRGGDRKEAELWVERVYRMPPGASAVLDKALEGAAAGQEMEPWQALLLLAEAWLSDS